MEVHPGHLITGMNRMLYLESYNIFKESYSYVRNLDYMLYTRG